MAVFLLKLHVKLQKGRENSWRVHTRLEVFNVGFAMQQRLLTDFGQVELTHIGTLQELLQLCLRQMLRIDWHPVTLAQILGVCRLITAFEVLAPLIRLCYALLVEEVVLLVCLDVFNQLCPFDALEISC